MRWNFLNFRTFIKNTPEDKLKGFDQELKAAVDEALKMLKEGKWQYEK